MHNDCLPFGEPSVVVSVTGHVKAVKNLGWLLRHWRDVASFDVAPYMGARMIEATLFARMRDGKTYATPYASRAVLRGFLDRPVFRGVPVSGLD